MSIWNKMFKLLINAALAYSTSQLVIRLYKYLYREQNEVILFYGPQELCASHHNSVKSNTFKNSNCSTCKVNKVIEWLNEAKSTLDVCMYMTNSEIFINALIDAHKRGVKIRMIVDNYGKEIWNLNMNGIAMRSKPTKTVENLMHHKFIILDNKKIILGSLNWTVAGIRQNWENVFITNQQQFVKPFRQEFLRLWTTF